MEQLIRFSLAESVEALHRFVTAEDTVASIAAAATVCADCLARGGKILSCGNGGSLCDAMHFAEELTGRYRDSRSSLPAICINDPAYMTCTANDFSFDEVFSRYVSGVGREGDVLLAISTSGTSPNVLKAVDAAHEKGIKVVALTSQGGVPLSERADIAVCAPRCPHSDRVQEIHIKVIHILIECIERRLDV